MTIILLLISFLASVAGAICGIGGGVIVKPVLDSLSVASVSTISFLSGCMVLSMSCYSVCKELLNGESQVAFRTVTPLAVGAAAGGILGNNLFSLLRAAAAQPERVGGYQAVSLAVIVLGTLLYTVKSDRIRTHNIRNIPACLMIGLLLGLISSFLSIGGGPINLVLFYYFFSMSTKTAAQNSLYIIFISQLASLLTTLATRSVPECRMIWLIAMVAGGVMGGIAGRGLNRRLNDEQVRKLFIVLMAVIIVISCYNAKQFLF
ncbi:sulfite exporter TauE/SafE family protein [Caproiciproducens sp. R2]|uniref:sulfite exporter TauE/SafE family protein n=1 Tax=Caproiciproducens sp. R2 TaxID=3435187 RepID=UPI0040347C05